MENIRDQAIAKMLIELNEKHSPATDQIHNWLCDQEDDALLANIIKPGKTIAGAYAYAKNLAQKEAQDGCACIEDVQVFEWVKEYFASDKPDELAKAAKPQKAAKADSVDADDDHEDEPEKAQKSTRVKKPTKKEIEAAEKAAKEAAATAAAAVNEDARKAAHAPNDQTTIFDFGA